MAQGTHKIPQNVTQYQGRVIGNFTAKQFIFLAIGAMFIFLIINAPLPNVAKIVAAVIVGFISLLFSLAKLQGRTTDEWFSYFFHVVNQPTQRVWRKFEFPPAFLLPEYKIGHKIVRAGRAHTEYELDRFIQLWNPTNPSNELSQEEKDILSRIQGQLAMPIGDAPAPVVKNNTVPESTPKIAPPFVEKNAEVVSPEVNQNK